MRAREDGREIEVDDIRIIGGCPGCKGEISVGFAPDPLNADKRTRCVLHTVPHCKFFSDNDPATIERAAREHAAKASPRVSQ